MDKAAKGQGTDVRKGIFSVVLIMSLNADTKAAEIVLMPNATYEMASAFMAECQFAMDFGWKGHVAHKTYEFIRQITGGRAYGRLSLVAYP